MKRILVVEDEKNILNFVATALEREGYEAITASNGQEGLAKFMSNKPDLVLLDRTMPVMNGPQMLEEMKQQGGINFVPIIMLTANMHAENIVENLVTCGVRDYIVKPFEIDELLKKIKKILKDS
jgi:DNA-binding response OmpR family regulator